MQEIIIPDDGLIYKTSDGKPVLQISFVNDAALFTLFSKNENSKILLLCHDSESGIFIGNGQKSIAVTVNLAQNEIRFTNENGKVTHLIYTTEDGGQIDLADDDGNSLISMGVNSKEKGSSFHIRNKKGESVVTIMNDKGSGGIVLLDKNGEPFWSIADE